MNKLYLLLIIGLTCTLGAFAQNYIKHTIDKDDSIKSITSFYHITEEELFELNPGARSELKPGSELLIPVKGPAVVKTAETLTFKKHKVRRKETLYSISKQYNITIEEIKRYNQALYTRELKKGEKIRIPVYESGGDQETGSTEIHVVQPKETRWGIANSYGITLQELQELNPEMGEIIKTGDTLYLPEREEMIETPTTDDYIFYEVKPGETLYSLTRFLNMSEAALTQLNPDLRDGLKAGMVLKIPKYKGEALEVRNAVVIKKFNLADSINRRHVSNIALMLPFKLGAMQVDSLGAVKKRLRSDKVFNYAMDFYSGALMAIDSVKKLGLSVNVQVFDSEGSASAVNRLLGQHNFKDFHAVIGPFYSTPFNTLSEALKDDDVPVIAPLTHKSIKLHHNVFQTVPSDDYLREQMIEFIKNHASDKQIIIITDSRSNKIVSRLQSAFPGAQTLVPEKDRTVTLYTISRKLSQEKENWFLLESNNEALVANVTSVLNSINREKYPITLLTTHKSDVFDSNNISNIHLSNLSFHYPTIDKLSLVESDFSKRYEARFYTTPSRYAIRGFDITFDVLLRLAYGGDLYRAARMVGETAYVENKFDYGKKFFGGYYNKAYYIVKYENLEIKEVQQ